MTQPKLHTSLAAEYLRKFNAYKRQSIIEYIAILELHNSYLWSGPLDGDDASMRDVVVTLF